LFSGITDKQPLILFGIGDNAGNASVGK